MILRFLKNIFARIWALWAIIWFVTTMLLILLPVIISGFLKEPRKSDVFWWLSHIWMRMFLPLAGCPLRVTGKQHFNTKQKFIVICNHNSLLDVPLSSPFIPGANRTIAKKDFMKVPLFNIIYKRGSVLVDRKSETSRRESFGKMKAALEQGFHMCIYPEGTRNKTGKPLQPFKDGAFRLAVETGTPIVPCILFNTAKAMPATQSFYLWPQRLYMHFLPPVAPGDMDVDTLKEKLFSVMEEFYIKHREDHHYSM